MMPGIYKRITECVYCGEEIEYSMENFKRGTIGEPACEDCIEKEEKGERDDD